MSLKSYFNFGDAFGTEAGGGAGVFERGSGPNYDWFKRMGKEPGDTWLWKQDNAIWNDPTIQSVVRGNQLFESQAAPIDAAYKQARVETNQQLVSSGLIDSGASSILGQELALRRGQALAGARAGADVTKAQFTAGFWGDALNRQLQAKGMRYGWLSQADSQRMGADSQAYSDRLGLLGNIF